jgi:glutamyl-tRNA reductase
MSLVAAGLSHQTAPVEDRERLAVSVEELPRLLRHFHAEYGSGVVLSTCNRTEVYVHTRGGNGEIPPSELMRELADFKGYDAGSALPSFYELEGADVARHLFRVAAGVDSMVLGEGQILGQVRSAFSAAHEARSLDAALSRLFHEAVRTGKQARAETNISRYAVSVSSAAVNLARQQVSQLAEARALVVGAGAAGKLAARALRDAGVQEIVVTNRTDSRAEDLAAYLGGRTVPFAQLDASLAAADLVVACSSAPGFLIDVAMAKRAVAGRSTDLTVLDVAVPRDVDPAVGGIDGVHLFDIDDLQAVSEANLHRRQEAAADVFSIVANRAGEFDEWLLSRRAVPTIRALVERADAVSKAETARTARDLGLAPAAAEKLDAMAAAIVKKLMHDPIAYLKYADDPEEATQVVRRIFGVRDD